MNKSLPLHNKVCVVTGANSGIGLVIAQSLAIDGAQLIMVCRDLGKGKEAQKLITRHAQKVPVLLLADLSDLAQIKRLSEEISDCTQHIDILVNNAGAIIPKRMESAQGLELTFALNHMGYFALTKALLPLVEASESGRIINVASRAHRVAQLDFSDLQWKSRTYRSFQVYGTTKLCNILFTRQLAKRLQQQNSKVTVNCLHPGVVRTGFGKDYKSVFSILVTLAGPFLISPKSGAKTAIYLAKSKRVEGQSGGYYDRCKLVKPRAKALQSELAEQLWMLSESLCLPFIT